MSTHNFLYRGFISVFGGNSSFDQETPSEVRAVQGHADALPATGEGGEAWTRCRAGRRPPSQPQGCPWRRVEMTETPSSVSAGPRPQPPSAGDTLFLQAAPAGTQHPLLSCLLSFLHISQPKSPQWEPRIPASGPLFPQPPNQPHAPSSPSASVRPAHGADRGAGEAHLRTCQ